MKIIYIFAVFLLFAFISEVKLTLFKSIDGANKNDEIRLNEVKTYLRGLLIEMGYFHMNNAKRAHFWKRMQADFLEDENILEIDDNNKRAHFW